MKTIIKIYNKSKESESRHLLKFWAQDTDKKIKIKILQYKQNIRKSSKIVHSPKMRTKMRKILVTVLEQTLSKKLENWKATKLSKF